MLTIQKEVPVAGRYQVVVCGGGPAGWVAAVAAARQGCRTALVERLGFLGGTATAGIVMPISGFFHNGSRVVGGIPWEFVQALEKEGAALVELPKGHVSADPEYYKLEAQRMALAAGVDLYTNSYLSGALTEGRRLRAVVFENKNGSEALEAPVFIDATGDGDLCALAGAPMTLPENPQPLSLCFELVGVDVSTPLLRDSIHHDGKNGSHSRNGVIAQYLREQYAGGAGPNFCGPWFNTLLKGDRLAVNITRSAASALDNRAYARGEAQLREDMFRLVELLRQKYPEFRNCAISSSAVNAGVREGRRLLGRATVLGRDLMAGKDFPDAIARNAHPVDIHVETAGDQILREMPRSGHIPYGALISPALDNLLAAGRMISADSQAHASLRVQATVMAIGQAAGVAAALCAESGGPVQGVDAGELRRRLTAAGGIV